MSDAPAPTVLIVEDEPMIRLTIADEYRDKGWQVLEADRGEAAVDTLSANHIDVLLTDIRLGGALTGWDVAEAWRKQRPDGPVIYVSGNGREPSRQVTGSLFFSKPYDANSVFLASLTLVGPST
jgi:DNA-binding response OmpR family regulator